MAFPASGAIIAGSWNINATASDDSAVVGLQFKLDGANIGAEFVSPPYGFLWDTRSIPNGDHLLTAVARDAAGNRATSAPVVVTITNTDLALHFDFEGGFSDGLVRDRSAHGNDGIGYNLAHWPGAFPGVVGAAAADFAPQQYIAVTNWNGLAVMPSGTIAVWAKFTTNSYENSTLLDAGDTGYPSSWRLGRDQSANVKFFVFDSNGNRQTKVSFPDDVIYNGVTPTFATANWHHYAVRWTGGNVIGFYDGSPISTNSLGTSYLRIAAGGHWMAIGTRQRDGTPQWGDDAYPNSYWMGGAIDELRMYNRALSDSEIRTLYRRVRPPGALRISATQ
jgi:hypothetical protein